VGGRRESRLTWGLIWGFTVGPRESFSLLEQASRPSRAKFRTHGFVRQQGLNVVPKENKWLKAGSGDMYLVFKSQRYDNSRVDKKNKNTKSILYFCMLLPLWALKKTMNNNKP